jgi:hypothetical protein
LVWLYFQAVNEPSRVGPEWFLYFRGGLRWFNESSSLSPLQFLELQFSVRSFSKQAVWLALVLNKFTVVKSGISEALSVGARLYVLQRSSSSNMAGAGAGLFVCVCCWFVQRSSCSSKAGAIAMNQWMWLWEQQSRSAAFLRTHVLTPRACVHAMPRLPDFRSFLSTQTPLAARSLGLQSHAALAENFAGIHCLRAFL